MKKTILFLFILCTFYCKAQIAVKFLQFRPVGEFGAVMEKTFTGELMYMSEFDDAWRTRFGFSFVSLKPRLDTFPVFAIKSGSGTSVLPGYQVFHKYDMFFLFGGMDYSFVEKDPLFLYAGMDVVAGGVSKEYDLRYETLSDESYSGGSKLGGIRLRLGGQYMLSEHAGVFIELTRSFYLIEEDGFFSNNDIGVGFQYIFDP